MATVGTGLFRLIRGRQLQRHRKHVRCQGCVAFRIQKCLNRLRMRHLQRPGSQSPVAPDAIKESIADGTFLYIARFMALRSLGFEMVKVPMPFVVEVRMSPVGSFVIAPRN